MYMNNYIHGHTCKLAFSFEIPHNMLLVVWILGFAEHGTKLIIAFTLYLLNCGSVIQHFYTEKNLSTTFKAFPVVLVFR